MHPEAAVERYDEAALPPLPGQAGGQAWQFSLRRQMKPSSCASSPLSPTVFPMGVAALAAQAAGHKRRQAAAARRNGRKAGGPRKENSNMSNKFPPDFAERF